MPATSRPTTRCCAASGADDASAAARVRTIVDRATRRGMWDDEVEADGDVPAGANRAEPVLATPEYGQRTDRSVSSACDHLRARVHRDRPRVFHPSTDSRMIRLGHSMSARRAFTPLRGLLLLSFLCVAVIPVSAQQARPIRALYITGGGFHDFAAQKNIVPPGISARTNIVWTIDHTADTSTKMLIPRHQTTAWADSFDVVVYNMSFSYVVDPQWIERIAHAHRNKGVAAVILHGATHSYRRSTSEAWKELMGAASMRHDRQREFPRLERLAADNPIVKALPKEWGPWSVEGEKHFPVVWTNTYGKAKVFATTMGHNNRTMSDSVYLDLVTRGLLW